MSPNDAQQPAEAPKKKSLYRRIVDSKRGEISEEDLKKYTGMNKAELSDWSKDRPGVGKNQPAGKLDMGPGSGFAGMAAADGFGGWGQGANPKMKFPPKKEESDKERALNSD
ncbi:hypothetical protein B0T11DRAFT_296022 [Plectosphaerella cucumerina]|jgi:hypothetical protein|uniref:Uncharacterized protein n=1 Tax=Plectosphaerella cucumerina TaxID=40658 RepID=A0A8K0X5Z9_9PEZI|nr:hypothetical protein B0T11DRAFT_296022 [Plectosphaerella cucumerina]